MLQFVFVCLVWDLAPSLGSRWHKPGPSPSVLLGAVGLGSEWLWEQIARQCGELVPHYCVIPLYVPSLGTATLAYPSLLTCAGSLSRDWSLCQRSCSHKGSWVGGGHSHPPQRLNIPRQTLQICLSCYVFSASHEREMSKKTVAIAGRREAKGWGGVSSMCRPHGCVWEGL